MSIIGICNEMNKIRSMMEDEKAVKKICQNNDLILESKSYVMSRSCLFLDDDNKTNTISNEIRISGDHGVYNFTQWEVALRHCKEYENSEEYCREFVGNFGCGLISEMICYNNIHISQDKCGDVNICYDVCTNNKEQYSSDGSVLDYVDITKTFIHKSFKSWYNLREYLEYHDPRSKEVTDAVLLEAWQENYKRSC